MESKSLCYRDKVHNLRWQNRIGVKLRTKFGFPVFCQLCCNDLWMPGLGQDWTQVKLRSRWELSATLLQSLVALVGDLFPSLDLFDILVLLYMRHTQFILILLEGQSFPHLPYGLFPVHLICSSWLGLLSQIWLKIYLKVFFSYLRALVCCACVCVCVSTG